MPEFILNRNDTNHLSDFVEGYVEAMFFTNGDIGAEDDEHRLNRLGTNRVTRKAWQDIKDDCEAFRHAVEMQYGRDAADILSYGTDGYDARRAGNDFWFTRQGHGVGYWDRDALPESIRDALSETARGFGEAYVETWRGWIHHA
jgi:hypothetical protein